MMTAQCTAPRVGHKRGSQAERDCPACAPRAARAIPAGAAAPKPQSSTAAAPPIRDGKHEVPISVSPTFPALAAMGFEEFVGRSEVEVIDADPYPEEAIVTRHFKSRHPNGTMVDIEMSFRAGEGGEPDDAHTISCEVQARYAPPGASQMTQVVLSTYDHGHKSKKRYEPDEFLPALMMVASRDSYGPGLSVPDVPGLERGAESMECMVSDGGNTVIESLLMRDEIQACRLGIDPRNADALGFLSSTGPLTDLEPDDDTIALAKAMYRDQ